MRYVIKSATFYLAKPTGSVFVMRQKQAHRFASRAEAEARVKAHPYPPNLRIVRLVPRGHFDKQEHPTAQYKVWTSIERVDHARAEYENASPFPVCGGIYATAEDADALVIEMTGESSLTGKKATAPGQWVALIVGEVYTNLQLCASEQAAKDQITQWIRTAVASDNFDAEFSQEIHGLFDAGRYQDAVERWEDETPDRVEIHLLNTQGSNDPEPEPLYLIDPVLDPVSLDAFLEVNDGLAPSEVEAIRALAVDEEYKGGGGAAAQWTIRRVR